MAKTNPTSDPTSGRLLTDVELELMTILWRLGEATVRDVMAEMPSERALAYTSVSTVIRILEQKGFVRSRPAGRTHVYGPRLSKTDYESRNLRHLVTGLFEGKPTTLVRRLVDATPLSRAELSELRELLEERLKK